MQVVTGADKLITMECVHTKFVKGKSKYALKHLLCQSQSRQTVWQTGIQGFLLLLLLCGMKMMNSSDGKLQLKQLPTSHITFTEENYKQETDSREKTLRKKTQEGKKTHTHTHKT